MSEQKNHSRVLVVGELHQDLFYKTNAYSELAEELASNIRANFNTLSADSENLQNEIRKLIIHTMQRTSKKYGCESYIKRGGNGNNSATILAKLGVSTGLLTVVGAGADWMYPEIEKLGIDTSSIFQKKDPTPISTIVEDPEITKIFIASNLKKAMNFEGIELPENLYENVALIFITPMDFKYKHILDVAVYSEKLTAFTLELQKIDNFNTFKQCVNVKTEFLFCNLDDAIKISHSELKDTLKSFDAFVQENSEIPKDKRDLSYQTYKMEQVDLLLRHFANVRVYTLGKYGSWLKFGHALKEETLHESVIPVNVVNRTGAGDTFAAGFIAKFVELVKTPEVYKQKNTGEKSYLFKICLKYATAASAMKVSTGESPSREQIVKLIRSQNE